MRIGLTRAFWIPRDEFYKNIEYETYRDTLDIYVYEPKERKSFYLMVFKGKAQKPMVNYSFSSEEKREEYIDRVKRETDGKIAGKQEEKYQKKKLVGEWVNSHKVGDIFSTSWGYDQTNVDFYQVVEVKPKSLVLRELRQNLKESGFMCGTVTPIKNDFNGDAFLSKIILRLFGTAKSGYELTESIKMGHYCGSNWDKTPQLCSWYA
jgi:hypothetical protein